MYNIPTNTTGMIDLTIILLPISIVCLIAGYILVRFKFYPIIYFIKGKIIKDKVLSEIENVHLKNMKQRYGLILTTIPVFGFSWGLFGIVLTCLVAFNQYLHYFKNVDTSILLSILNFWIITNIIVLALIPLLFLFTKATIPAGMRRSLNNNFFFSIVLFLSFGITYSYLEYHLSFFALVFYILLSIPCIFATWFIGQYIAVYVIRSIFQTRGWDFVLNEKVSIFGRLKGLSSLIFAILTPIIAINSLLAVFFKNTSKGGFLGIWIMSLTNFSFNWTWTFHITKFWSYTFVFPSLTTIASVIIIFLIVGPLVTFIFRPTYIFELTLNSKIYQTLINLNWDELKDYISTTDDSIIIHSLSESEMIGILIFFISFINYIALLSVGAVVASFNINLDQIIGLNVLDGTIKLVEIPILLFVEYLILHDLSEERELVHLASKGRKSSKRDPTSSPYTKKIMVPDTVDKSQSH